MITDVAGTMTKKYDTFHEQAEELVEKWKDTLTREEFICYASQGRLDEMVGDAIRAAYKFGRIEAFESSGSSEPKKETT